MHAAAAAAAAASRLILQNSTLEQAMTAGIVLHVHLMQAHASKVTALSFSPGGAALWTGCDAAAPKPALDSTPDLPVAMLNSLVSCLTCQIW